MVKCVLSLLTPFRMTLCPDRHQQNITSDKDCTKTDSVLCTSLYLDTTMKDITNICTWICKSAVQ